MGAGVLLAFFVISSGSNKPSTKDSTEFVKGLTTDKKKLMNISIILGRMKTMGVINKFVQAAILAIISKESGFIPVSEDLNYTATSIGTCAENMAAIIEGIGRVFNVNKSTAEHLAHNPELLANYVYGGKGGNAPDEGYKYRGRGFNQITFKNTYRKIGQQIGYDLVGNPDLLNNPIIAADAAIQYFKNGIAEGARNGKLAQYHATNINDFKNLNDAFGAIYHINAGWGASSKKILADVTGGRKHGLAAVQPLYTLVTHAA